MKYQSEIIKEIIASKGHTKSLPHYESECVETWIEEAKGAYPKITEYKGEWLVYINDNNGIGEFPYVSLTDVTEATIENVVPYAYKSAILKGDSQRVFSPTKNLFDGELEQGTISSSTGNNSDLSTAIRSKNFVEIGVNTAFTLSRKKGTSSLGFRCYDKNKNFLGTIFTTINGGTLKVTYTTDSNTVYIRFIDNTNDLTNKYQIEIGSTATDYEEPNYELKSVKMPVLTTSNEDGTKTNILTTNEEVELRKLGNVQDELDLLTGELTQRVGKIVLDGSQQVTKWNNTLEQPNTLTWNITIDDMMCNSNILSDKLKVMINPSVVNDVDEEAVSASESNNRLYIRLSKSRGLTEADVMNNLSQNPITVSYQLATESIKTVDLTVTNQDGNTESIIKPIEGTMYVITSSQTLPPLLDMSVPVEATSQNLMSFANIIEEEK